MLRVSLTVSHPRSPHAHMLICVQAMDLNPIQLTHFPFLSSSSSRVELSSPPSPLPPPPPHLALIPCTWACPSPHRVRPSPTPTGIDCPPAVHYWSPLGAHVRHRSATSGPLPRLQSIKIDFPMSPRPSPLVSPPVTSPEHWHRPRRRRCPLLWAEIGLTDFVNRSDRWWRLV
jgi:hypothetical protein